MGTIDNFRQRIDNTYRWSELRNREFGKLGHKYITSGGQSPASPAATDFFYFTVTDTDGATVTYTDPAGNAHTAVVLIAGDEVFCSGVVTVSAGTVRAYMNV
jgi:hypothetical protein